MTNPKADNGQSSAGIDKPKRPSQTQDVSTGLLAYISRDLSTAISFTTFLLISIVIVYFFAHMNNFDRGRAAVAEALSQCAQYQNDTAPVLQLCSCGEANTDNRKKIEDAVPWSCALSFTATGFFDIRSNDDLLLRFFSPARVDEFKTGLDADLRNVRDSAIAKRRMVIDDAARTLHGHYDQKSDGRPTPLGLYEYSADNHPVPFAPDTNYALADVLKIADWLEVLQTENPQNNEIFITQIAQLRMAWSAERADAQSILERPLTLDDSLSFRWLFIEDGKWLIELSMISIIGVLIKTITALLAMAQNQGTRTKYQPGIFLLFIPQLVMAPIVAIVVLAMVVAGITGITLTLSNLPVFLFFAFLLGFANDRLIEIIRGAVKYFIPRMAVNEEKIKAQYGREARKAARRRLSGFEIIKETPRTVPDLKVIAADRASVVLAKSLSARPASEI